MCGIFGVVSNGAPVDIERLKRASASLSHRGPDGEGFLLGNGGGFELLLDAPPRADVVCHLAWAHRRLAIIDLVTGQQPISNEDRTVWCMLNGEIYNYRRLRDTLRAFGHAFRTESDTEVLCHGWEQWGEGLVDQLEGMFAFAIHDRRQERMLLFRDPLGIKPLCYSLRNHVFSFASEAKALLAYDPAIRLDREAVFDFFLHDQIPGSRTPYAEVRHLGPGQRLSLDCRTLRLERPVRYWSVRFEVRPRPLDQIVEEVGETLARVVVKQKVADVPVGTFLSGGIDSSLVTLALLADGPTKAIHLHSQGEWSEYRWAMHPAFSGVERIDVPFAPRLEDCLAALRQIDDPLRDASLLPTYLVSKAAVASGLKVVLSGDGGDENFAGYDLLFHSAYLFERYESWGLTKWGRNAAAFGLFCATLGIRDPYRSMLRGYLRAGTYLPTLASVEVNNLLSTRKAAPGSVADFRVRALSEVVSQGDPHPRLNALLDVTYRHFLNVVLAKVDAASMANSLEVRVPLLDQELVRLALSIPFAAKVRGKGKYPLKALAERHFGRRFAFRQKSAFNVDYAALFRVPAIASHLLEALAVPGVEEFLDVESVRSLLPAAERGQQGKRLWRALMFAEWFRNWGRSHA